MHLFSRRDTLKYFGLGIASMFLPGEFEFGKMFEKSITLPKKLYMDEWMIGFNHRISGSESKVGDYISFYPSLQIDYYAETDPPVRRTLNHIIYNVYEFYFTSVAGFLNNLKEFCFHNIIEIMPDFELFHFNWHREYDQYLEAFKWYKGYGRITNCGDPSEENPFIDATAIKGISQRAKLKKILINQVDIEDHSFRNTLAQLGYFHDYAKFRKNLRNHLYKPKEIESTTLRQPGDELVYCVELNVNA